MRRLAITILVGAVGLVGCGDDTGTGGAGAAGGAGSGAAATGGGGAGGGANAPSMQSGTRLKVKVQRAGDADTYWSLYDADLAMDCAPQTGFDDKLRCYPSSSAFVGYLDAACTQPVAGIYLGPCNPEVPAYATETLFSSGPGCSSTYATRAYAIGAEVATMSPFFAMVDGMCAEQGTAEVLYTATPVDDGSLVALDAVEEARGTDLAAKLWTSADGMRLAGYTARDVARAVDCQPSLFGDGERCAPTDAAFVSAPAFADAACSDELVGGVALGTLGCPAPTVARSYETTPQTSCEAQVAMFQIGASLPDAFRPDENGCSSIAGGSSLFELGAPIPDTSFPAVQRVDVGSGNVKAIHHQAAGADLIAPTQFVSANGTLCFPYPFSDGVTRCGPPTIAYVGPTTSTRLFADAACTELLVAINDGCPTPDSVDYAVMSVEAQGCAGLEPHSLGAVHTGDVFAKTDVGPCTSTPPDPAFIYRTVGAAVPPTDFVEVTRVTL